MKTKQVPLFVLFALISLTYSKAQVNDFFNSHPGPLNHNYSIPGKGTELQSLHSDTSTGKLKPLPYTPGLALRLQNILDNNPVENMSAAIMFPNGDIWTGVKGYANDSTKISPNTVFSIGSITKTFVAATLLKMADEGKLSLDDSIYKFLPKYRNIDSCITVRMLLSHSSGLYNFTENGNWDLELNREPDSVWQPEEVLDKLVLKPVFPTGKGKYYSNTNFVVAGMIISKISGKELSKALREYTFDPYNLGNTTIFPEDHLGSELCDAGTGYYRYGTIAGYSSAGAAGAAISKPDDLIRWAGNLYSGKVFSDTAFKQMIKSRIISAAGSDTFSYGLGMLKAYLDRNGEDAIVYGHTGGMANIAYMGYIPGDSLAIASCFKDEYDEMSTIQNLYTEVMGVVGPVNDSIINAIELTEGVNGPFYNSTASIEMGEPRPPKNGCNTQNGWCEKGGLQNTLWFWFKAPESGVVSFTADGFDNQLAVYQAKNSDSLLNGNYSLLAANDNAVSGKYPVIFNLQGLVPYEKYYLQLAGWGGIESSIVTYAGIEDKANINYYIDELKLLTDKDTIILDAATGSCDSVYISTEGPWVVSGISGWLKVTPVTGNKSGLLVLTTTDKNTTAKARKCNLAIKLLGYQNKIIPVFQKPINTGISKTAELDLIISPNPVLESLEVHLRNMNNPEFMIYNIQGVKYLSGKLQSDFNTIDVRRLPVGIYFIRISGGNGIQTVKFIKQ